MNMNKECSNLKSVKERSTSKCREQETSPSARIVSSTCQARDTKIVLLVTVHLKTQSSPLPDSLPVELQLMTSRSLEPSRCLSLNLSNRFLSKFQRFRLQELAMT